MAKAVDSITLDDSLRKPHLCEDETDFYKFMLFIVEGMAEDQEEADSLIVAMKVLLHEYLALVLSEKISPYAGDGPDEETIKAFREAMTGVTKMMIDLGIPMVETDNGKLTVDMDAVKKKLKEKYGKSS